MLRLSSVTQEVNDDSLVFTVPFTRMVVKNLESYYDGLDLILTSLDLSLVILMKSCTQVRKEVGCQGISEGWRILEMFYKIAD